MGVQGRDPKKSPVLASKRSTSWASWADPPEHLAHHEEDGGEEVEEGGEGEEKGEESEGGSPR